MAKCIACGKCIAGDYLATHRSKCKKRPQFLIDSMAIFAKNKKKKARDQKFKPSPLLPTTDRANKPNSMTYDEVQVRI